MEIRYQIEFLSYWHCSSGLTGGADADVLSIRDKRSLPFVPGKTIKGLVRELYEDYVYPYGEFGSSTVEELFGYFDGKDNLRRGKLFFSDAQLDPSEADEITDKACQEFLFKNIASTAIDEKGVAKEHSLRQIEVVIPCTLKGRITGVEQKDKDAIIASLKMIKRIGLDRNRGLGRCIITEI